MENHNQTLKEKEINRSYYLKRMLIWQQISSPFSFFIIFFASIFLTFAVLNLLGWKLSGGNELDDDFREKPLFSLLTFFVLIACLFAFSTYYSTKFWKADKEYQELVTSILTKIDMREEKR